MDYVLAGGGDFALEVYEWFDSAIKMSGGAIVGFMQDEGFASSEIQHRIPRLGRVSTETADGKSVIIAVASPDLKKKWADILLGHVELATIIHPTCIASPSARFGRGVTIAPLSIVSSNAVIDDGVTINPHCSVGHDVTIGAYSSLSSHVDITGRVKIEDRVFFGSGARVLPNVRVGSSAIVGAGSTVVRNVGAKTTLFASPARVLQVRE